MYVFVYLHILKYVHIFKNRGICKMSVVVNYGVYFFVIFCFQNSLPWACPAFVTEKKHINACLRSSVNKLGKAKQSKENVCV